MNAGQSSFKGIRALRVLVLMPLAIIVVIALAFAFYEAHKAYWDYRVDQLCAQDGGVKIREVAYLDPQQYEQMVDRRLGPWPIVPEENSPKRPGAAVYYRWQKEVIRSHNPTVVRSVYMLVRAADGVTIATSIRYGRSGGDLIALHQSSHHCPAPLANVTPVESAIQLKREAN